MWRTALALRVTTDRPSSQPIASGSPAADYSANACRVPRAPGKVGSVASADGSQGRLRANTARYFFLRRGSSLATHSPMERVDSARHQAFAAELAGKVGLALDRAGLRRCRSARAGRPARRRVIWQSSAHRAYQPKRCALTTAQTGNPGCATNRRPPPGMGRLRPRASADRRPLDLFPSRGRAGAIIWCVA
jgi:hypothetical protein